VFARPSHRDPRPTQQCALLVTMGSTMHATQEQLRDAKVDLAYRDFCAHLLIPLNNCRKENYFLPWRCGHERHVYEKCQYKECVVERPEMCSLSATRASNPSQTIRAPETRRPRATGTP